ncbi:AsnC family transcriptional regulator [Candidatus Bathyarchaeota archaeon ex4484_205]|nr:MAG: AsnC family transcriptional regulator [Candidatus Bathyarchaeota archaeon ex4484_205]HDN17442.1 Lrp/AsnC family transcriptional regulator [Candidatus Bathyarchaeota archaeon]
MDKAVYILVNVKPGKEDEILQEILNVESVIEAWRIYGAYDVLIKIKNEGEDTLWKAIEEIRHIQDIESTLTLYPISGFEKKS